MTEFYAFAGEHWLLTWCALWLVWGVLWLAVVIVTLPLRIIVRTLRAVVVAIRGWPPAHLDADGDWKPEPERK